MSIDVVGNFLTIIRNGIMRSKPYVQAPYTRLNHEIAGILKLEGFIKDVVVEESDPVKKTLKIYLKYVDGESVIHEISRESKPGRRVYQNHKQLKPVIGNLGISILTTSHGVMTNKQAKQTGTGGEVICSVW